MLVIGKAALAPPVGAAARLPQASPKVFVGPANRAASPRPVTSWAAEPADTLRLAIYCFILKNSPAKRLPIFFFTVVYLPRLYVSPGLLEAAVNRTILDTQFPQDILQDYVYKIAQSPIIPERLLLRFWFQLLHDSDSVHVLPTPFSKTYLRQIVLIGDIGVRIIGRSHRRCSRDRDISGMSSLTME
jgi:hypothetical protein